MAGDGRRREAERGEERVERLGVHLDDDEGDGQGHPEAKEHRLHDGHHAECTAAPSRTAVRRPDDAAAQPQRGSMFCRRTRPRATSLPSSAREMTTSQSCWLRPWYTAVADDVEPARGGGAEEVGGVGDADGVPPALADRDPGADRGERLHDRGEHAAVEDAERLVVLRAHLEPAGDARRAHLVEVAAEQLEEVAGAEHLALGLERGGGVGCVGHAPRLAARGRRAPRATPR